MSQCAWCGKEGAKLKTPVEGELVCDLEECATEYANSRGVEPLTKKLAEKAKKAKKSNNTNINTNTNTETKEDSTDND